MKKLIKITAKVLNIHEEPLKDENAIIEISMKELHEIVKKMTKSK